MGFFSIREESSDEWSMTVTNSPLQKEESQIKKQFSLDLLEITLEGNEYGAGRGANG